MFSVMPQTGPLYVMRITSLERRDLSTGWIGLGFSEPAPCQHTGPMDPLQLKLFGENRLGGQRLTENGKGNED